MFEKQLFLNHLGQGSNLLLQGQPSSPVNFARLLYTLHFILYSTSGEKCLFLLYSTAGSTQFFQQSYFLLRNENPLLLTF